jgi:hypothetical protein
MTDDFFISAAQRRANELAADLAEIDASLARARADGNSYAASEMIQNRANILAERRNLEASYNEYVRAQQPQQQVPTTEGEFMARAPERMTGEDVDRIFRKSKYARDINWSDPSVASRVQQGLAEVQRRKARGE